jgi:hypothetical protein
MARTAVISGTATAVSGNVARRQMRKAQADMGAAPQPVQVEAVSQEAQLAALPTAPPAGDDMMAKLQQLADLKNAGVLTDEEFSAAKAKILAS